MIEVLFNTQLGTATRVWAYSHTLNNYQLAKRRFTYKVPFYEQLIFPSAFPVISSTIRRKLNVTPEAATSAYKQVVSIFETVSN